MHAQARRTRQRRDIVALSTGVIVICVYLDTRCVFMGTMRARILRLYGRNYQAGFRFFATLTWSLDDDKIL